MTPETISDEEPLKDMEKIMRDMRAVTNIFEKLLWEKY